jgi:hypothetical protein
MNKHSINKSEGTMSEEYLTSRIESVNEDATEAAASALTALSLQPKPKEHGSEQVSFEIPERFTKSGRKKAVPFPVKVRNKKEGRWALVCPALSKCDVVLHNSPKTNFFLFLCYQFPADESSIRQEI